MSRRPRRMTKLQAATRLKATLELVLYDCATAGADRVQVTVKADGEHEQVEVLSNGDHVDDGADLRRALATKLYKPEADMTLEVTARGADGRRRTWTAPKLEAPGTLEDPAAARRRADGKAPPYLSIGNMRVRLEYRREDPDGGAETAAIAAEAARYYPAEVHINHDGTTRTGRQDYLEGAVAVTENDVARIGVMRTPDTPPMCEKRGGFVYVGQEEELFPDAVDALDNMHYHARMIVKPTTPSRPPRTLLRAGHERQALRQMGMKAVFDHLKSAPVPRRVQRLAAAAGVEIPDPPIRLAPWKPATAAETGRVHQLGGDEKTLPYRRPESAVGPNSDGTPALIIKRDKGTHPAAEQLIAIALETENRLRLAAGRGPIRFALENHRLEGYAGYDRLPYTRAESLSMKNIDDPGTVYEADGARGPVTGGGARPGWTVCLPIMEERDGTATVTGHVHLASPVRYSGRTTGKRLQNDEYRVGNGIEPASLKLTRRRGADPEATTRRIEQFLTDSFGPTDAETVGTEDGGRPMIDIALALTATARERRRAMIGMSVRAPLDAYASIKPGLDTVIRVRRPAVGGELEIDVTETPTADTETPTAE